MSALTEALHRAFPDMTPDQYPWPASPSGHAGVDVGQTRGSWPAPPRTCTSASAAQQALDLIRQAALPAARPHSASRGSVNDSRQQVASRVGQHGLCAKPKAVACAALVDGTATYVA